MFGIGDLIEGLTDGFDQTLQVTALRRVPCIGPARLDRSFHQKRRS